MSAPIGATAHTVGTARGTEGNHDGRDDHPEVGRQPSLAPARGPSEAQLAATLLAGGLIGAAAYAGIGAATAQPAAVSATVAHGFSPDAPDSFRYSRPISAIGADTQQRGRFDLR